jgi:hypothetical protein
VPTRKRSPGVFRASGALGRIVTSPSARRRVLIHRQGARDNGRTEFSMLLPRRRGCLIPPRARQPPPSIAKNGPFDIRKLAARVFLWRAAAWGSLLVRSAEGAGKHGIVPRPALLGGLGNIYRFFGTKRLPREVPRIHCRCAQAVKPFGGVFSGWTRTNEEFFGSFDPRVRAASTRW